MLVPNYQSLKTQILTLVVERHPLWFASTLDAFERHAAVIPVDAGDDHTTTCEVLIPHQH